MDEKQFEQAFAAWWATQFFSDDEREAQFAAWLACYQHLAPQLKDAELWQSFSPFLIEHLKCWKDEGIPAPVNELQSIAAWLRTSCDGLKPMQNSMRMRMLLLMKTAHHLHDKGLEEELKAGIYENRPDMAQEAIDAALDQQKEKQQC